MTCDSDVAVLWHYLVMIESLRQRAAAAPLQRTSMQRWSVFFCISWFVVSVLHICVINSKSTRMY